MSAPEEKDPATQEKNGFSFLRLLYSQIGAVLGAISMIVFVSNFIDFGLRGVVHDAVTLWTDYVRPLIGYPMQWFVDWIGWRVEVPALVKDYVGAGFVLAFSYVRTAQLLFGRFAETDRDVDELVKIIVFWPMYVVLTVVDTLRGKWPIKFSALVLAPLIYMALILTLNYRL